MPSQSSPSPIGDSGAVPPASTRRASRSTSGPLVGLVLGGLLLAGCAAESGSTSPDDVVGQGYQSGDGSLRTWAVDDRGEPVRLVGEDFEGNPVDTGAGGSVVVLNTWYAACPPCRAEAPDLLEVATGRADDGVRFVGINGTDDAGAALAFEREHDVTWPSIADTDGSVMATLQGVVPVQAVPTTVVLDLEGRVAARVLGQVDASTLDGLVADVLAESDG
ncbi:TlpA family protein disulfide reductase [Sanguibacter sp. YZGR15]|uniref:TlpA family protein disulfide reductase n=1 Tax=Sanguibacter suaedae TaxID=2795737 RepID=A0A934I1P4_9MICO|nr:TlpA family protein disulfide reductase [Sanguibacter suaedae]